MFFDEFTSYYFILSMKMETYSSYAIPLVGYAISVAYYSFSAGLNGIARPLNGLPNQEVNRWILDL
jgi:citrate synthase